MDMIKISRLLLIVTLRARRRNQHVEYRIRHDLSFATSIQFKSSIMLLKPTVRGPCSQLLQLLFHAFIIVDQAVLAASFFLSPLIPLSINEFSAKENLVEIFAKYFSPKIPPSVAGEIKK